MATNYSQHWDDAARRHRAADVARQHDQRDRQQQTAADETRPGERRTSVAAPMPRTGRRVRSMRSQRWRYDEPD